MSPSQKKSLTVFRNNLKLRRYQKATQVCSQDRMRKLILSESTHNWLMQSGQRTTSKKTVKITWDNFLKIQWPPWCQTPIWLKKNFWSSQQQITLWNILRSRWTIRSSRMCLPKTTFKAPHSNSWSEKRLETPFLN